MDNWSLGRIRHLESFQKAHHQEKHQSGIRRMENEIGNVKPEGVHSPDGIIELVAQKSQRDVELWIVSRESSFHMLPCHTAHKRILRNEEIVIPPHKTIP